MAFYPYPPLPVEEGKYLAPLLRGKAPDDLNKALRAAWSVQGYGMSVLLPESAPVGALMTHQAADFLEKLGDPAVADTSTWQLLLPIVANLIVELLKKRFGA